MFDVFSQPLHINCIEFSFQWDHTSCNAKSVHGATEHTT